MKNKQIQLIKLLLLHFGYGEFTYVEFCEVRYLIEDNIPDADDVLNINILIKLGIIKTTLDDDEFMHYNLDEYTIVRMGFLS